jgi:hypothetical protein
MDTCYFVFTLSSELCDSATIERGDLTREGFHPCGIFERIIGRALVRVQETSRGSFINFSRMLLHKDLAILHFGTQRFRLVLCSDIYCIRLDVEGENPSIHEIIHENICDNMRVVNCFAALWFCKDKNEQLLMPSNSSDIIEKELSQDYMLILIEQMRNALNNTSHIICRKGGRSLLSQSEIRYYYGAFLQEYTMKG